MLKFLSPIAAIVLGACAATPEFEASVDEPPTPAPVYSLADLPYPETFNQLAFNGSPIGFTYLGIEALADEQYRIHSQAFMNLNLIATEKVSVVNSVSVVDSNLRLKEFDYRYWVDGVESHISGAVTGLELTADVVRNGHLEQRTVALKRPVLPSAALALVPAMRGLEIGREHNFSFLDGETLRVKVVQQSVQTYESSDEVVENAFKILSNVQGQAVRTWMSADGQPLFESSMGGIVTAKTTELESSRQAVIDSVLDKQDSHRQLARVVSDVEIEAPEAVTSLQIVLDGLPASLEIPSDLFQYCESGAQGVVCETSSPALDTKIIGTSFDDTAAYLSASDTVSADADEVGEVAAMFDGLDEATAIAAVLPWLASNIKLESGVTTTAADVLENRRGGVRGQVLLYAAVARRLQIPTRVLHGIVYSQAHKSFVYHCWAESWIDGLWHRVDPVARQLPADGTHIALIEGETLAAPTPLFEMMGRLRVRVLDVRRGSGAE